MVDTQTVEGIQQVESQIQVGFMQLANGQTTTQINSDEDIIPHLTKFMVYLTDIKASIESETTKAKNRTWGQQNKYGYILSLMLRQYGKHW